MHGFPGEEDFMTRSGRVKLALAAMVSVCLILGCEYETVYFSFGQHVDFYHSYRLPEYAPELFDRINKTITSP